MNHIRIYVNKEKDVLAFSFDGVGVAAFPLSRRTFKDDPTYEAAYAWFYDEDGPDIDVATQDALARHYSVVPVNELGDYTEL